MKDKNLSLSSKANNIVIIRLCLLKQSDAAAKNKGKITMQLLSDYMPWDTCHTNCMGMRKRELQSIRLPSYSHQ